MVLDPSPPPLINTRAQCNTMPLFHCEMWLLSIQSQKSASYSTVVGRNLETMTHGAESAPQKSTMERIFEECGLWSGLGRGQFRRVKYVAACCSVLQCAAVCCSVLQCAAACCSVLQCVAVCCSVLQCIAVCCSVLQCIVACCSESVTGCVTMTLQPGSSLEEYTYVTMCCSVM